MARPRLPLPYIGLRAYEESDHLLFFGREAQVVSLLRKLEENRFVAVLGSSGSGKSSLVKAGLVPALREGYMDGETEWAVLLVRPGKEPYENLARAVIRATAQDRTDAPPEVKTLADQIRRSDRGLLDVLEKLVPPERRVLVIIDQFEELFGFRKLNTAKDTCAPRDIAAGFVSMLLKSSAEKKGRVWVLLTMRSDFSGDCEAFLGLPEAVSESQFLVPRLNRWQMHDAIVGPSQVEDAGYKPFTLAPDLVNRIINDAGDRPDQLPLMQHALMQTWKVATGTGTESKQAELTLQHYETVGGIAYALSKHADAAWSLIETPLEKSVAKRLFLLLSETAQDGQLVRRRTSVSEVLESCTEAKIENIRNVVALFRADDRNFVFTMPEGPLVQTTVIDVSHEALLRCWDLLNSQWLPAERADASELRRLAEQVEAKDAPQPLSGNALLRATHWRQLVTEGWSRRYVKPAVWQGIQKFIRDSETTARKTANRNRNRWIGIGVVLVLATVVSIYMGAAARSAKQDVARVLTKSYVTVIGSSSSEEDLSVTEVNALWELAELTDDYQYVREAVIDEWFKKDGLVAKPLLNDSIGLLAATGLNEELLSRVSSEADAYIHDRLGAKGRELLALAKPVASLGTMASEEHKMLVARALTDAMKSADNRGNLIELADPLAGVLSRLADQDAARAAAQPGIEALIGALLTQQSSRPVATEVIALSAALGRLADYIPREQLVEIGELLFKLYSRPQLKQTEVREKRSVARSVAPLLAAMPEGAARSALAHELARREIDWFDPRRGRTNFPGRAYLASMAGGDIEGFALDLAVAMADGALDVMRPGMLPGLKDVMARVPADRAPAATEKVIDRWEHSTGDSAQTFALVVSMWLDRLPPAQRQPLIDRVLADIRKAPRSRDHATQSQVTLARFLHYTSPRATVSLASTEMQMLLVDAATAAHETQIAEGDFDELQMELVRVRLWMPLLAANKAQDAAGAIFTSWRDAELPMSEELGQSYLDLAPYLRADDAEQTAKFLANDLINDDSIVDDEDWEDAGKILAVLVKQVSPEIRRKLTEDLVTALEKPRFPHPTATYVTPLLALLGEGGTEPLVARSSRRASLALLKTIQADTEADAQTQVERGRQMYRVASYLPMSESSTLRLLALSMVVPQRNRFVDAELTGWIGELPRADLISMLKWPICRGAVRQAVLDKLAASGKKANGDLWMFVFRNHESAFGEGFDSPAHRPSIDVEVDKLKKRLKGPDPVLASLR